MSILAKLSLAGASLGLLFLLVEFTIPAVVDHFDHQALVQHCDQDGWITDTCVELPEFWEYVK